MVRRIFWMSLVVLVTAATGFAAESKKLNIILFYVDDLGWMDLACQGSDFYETPNIDRLAKEGIRYTQGYTSHPRCLPARYGLIAGCFPARLAQKVEGAYSRSTRERKGGKRLIRTCGRGFV
jgi:hypothetical protein